MTRSPIELSPGQLIKRSPTELLSGSYLALGPEHKIEMEDSLRSRICARNPSLLKAECFFEKLIDRGRDGGEKGDCDNQLLESEYFCFFW